MLLFCGIGRAKYGELHFLGLTDRFIIRAGEAIGQELPSAGLPGSQGPEESGIPGSEPEEGFPFPLGVSKAGFRELSPQAPSPGFRPYGDIIQDQAAVAAGDRGSFCLFHFSRRRRIRFLRHILNAEKRIQLFKSLYPT